MNLLKTLWGKSKRPLRLFAVTFVATIAPQLAYLDLAHLTRSALLSLIASAATAGLDKALPSPGEKQVISDFEQFIEQAHAHPIAPAPPTPPTQ